MSKHSISLDLLRQFRLHGHNVYVVCSADRKSEKDTILSVEDGCKVLRVRIGNNKAGLIEKGLTTFFLPRHYIRAIKDYFSDVHFDLVLYPTPPVTHVKTVAFIKKRDHARSYLLLRDIFPQNAVDIGIMSKSGLKGIIYRYFRRVEKKLYDISDRIGCMSQANMKYLLDHNPGLDPNKIEIFPNSIEIVDVTISDAEKTAIREKYGIPSDKTVFVYGGNLGKPQGVPFILECLDRLRNEKNAFFLIVGNGTEFGKIKAFMDNNNSGNMLLLNRLPKEDYDRMIPACDVGLIFLDHRFTIPNFPSRLLAYMQAGLPVLAATDPNTDIGEVITEGGFGWWCESNDVSAFCELVKKACALDLTEMKKCSFLYLRNHYQSKDTYHIIMSEKDSSCE